MEAAVRDALCTMTTIRAATFPPMAAGVSSSTFSSAPPGVVELAPEAEGAGEGERGPRRERAWAVEASLSAAVGEDPLTSWNWISEGEGFESR